VVCIMLASAPHWLRAALHADADAEAHAQHALFDAELAHLPQSLRD
jgi:hypothetical protein